MPGTNPHAPGRAGKDSLTVLRLLALVSLLQHESSGMSMEAILGYLDKIRLPVSERQLQRDLKQLAPLFGLISRTSEIDGRVFWSGNRMEQWRFLFKLSGVGSTNLGEDPLGLDATTVEPIMLPGKPQRIGRNLLKLLRVLLIVEMLPSESDPGWTSLNEIHQQLADLGVQGSLRTLSRDMAFIKQHFLVITWSSHGACKGVQGPWKRLEPNEWHHGFEPRFPKLEPEHHQAVRDFLYRRPPPGHLLH